MRIGILGCKNGKLRDGKVSVPPSILRRALILAAVIVASLAGCGGLATVSPSWTKTAPAHDRRYTSKFGITLELPAKWMMIEDNSALILTRHGTPFDAVQIRRHELPASLSGTELTIDSQMRFYELAEIVINNIRGTAGVIDLVISEVAYYEIDGRDGFLVSGAYKVESGLVRRYRIYGFIHGNERDQYYTEIGLYALDDYYFDAVSDEFSAIVNSVGVDGRVLTTDMKGR